jgi:hypothetical protein
MSKAAEETLGLADSEGEIVDSQSLIDLQRAPSGKAAKIRNIFADAIDAWLSTVLPASQEESADVREARALARRYRYPYVDLFPARGNSPIQNELVNEFPVELMLKFQFVPLRREGKRLHLAISDPSDLQRLDELATALQSRLVPHVTTAGAIELVLRQGDTTQRVLREAASEFLI